MRVAIFSEVYWPMVSGVALTLRRLHDALTARGHVVRVFTSTYPLAEEVPDRVEVHRSPSRPLFVAPDVQWAFPRQRTIRAVLEAFAPDVVHLATEFAMGMAGLRAGRALGLPIVATAHTDYERYAADYGLTWLVAPGWRYLRWFYGHAHRVLAPTQVYEAHLRRRGIPHTGLFSRGVDAELFHPRWRSAEWRAGLGAGGDDVLVSYIGRLAPEKGIRVLLDAWEQLGPRRRGAKLIFVGSGLMEPEIRGRALPDVHLLGMQHGTALSTAYASSDVLAFPSATETFGNVVLEAMASGLPAVAAAAGGLLDYAHHGANAWLVEPGSTDALAEGLARLIDDAALRRALGHGARATALGRRWDGIFDGLERDYRAAIAALTPGHAAAA